MKLNPIFVIPMMVPMAHASLPDEINYEPYKIQYERLSAEVDTITANLNRAESDLQTTFNQEANISNAIQNIQDENLRLRNQINAHLSEREALTIRADELLAVVNRLETRLSRAQTNERNLRRQLRDENQRLKPLRDRLQNINARLRAANEEVERASLLLNRARTARNNLKTQHENLQTKVQTLKTQIDTKEEQLANIESSISQAETRLGNLQGKLGPAKRQANQLAKNDAKLNEEVAGLQMEMRRIISEIGNPREARTDPRVIEIRQKIASKRGEININAGLLSEAKAIVTDLEGKISQVQSRIANLNRSKNTLPGEIAAKKNELRSTRTELQQTKTNLDAAQANVQSQKAIVDAKVQEANTIAASKTRLEDRLARESVNLDQLIAQINQVESTIANVGQRLNQRASELNSTQRQLDIIARQLPQLRSDVANNRRQLNSLDTQLVTIQNRIVVLSEDVDRIRSQQTNTMVSRDRKYEEYVSRLDYYNQKLSEAKTLGASQTDIALSVGRSDGNIYVARRASRLGSQIGNQLAEAQASYWSNVRAEISGYSDGYAEGYASDADEARGKREGRVAGQNAATDYANTTLKPQFFNEIFAAKLKTQNMNFSPLASASMEELDKIETEMKVLSDVLVGVSPVSASEVNESLGITTNLDGQISTFKKNLSEIIAQKNSTSIPRNTYQSPSEVPFGSFDCSNIYRGVAEFKAACENEYYDVFEGKYKEEYYSTYAAQYTGLFDAKVEDVRAANIVGIYEVTYDQAYPVAKASGVSSGKEQIFKEAYAQAYEAGYQAQLPSATATARGTARSEVDQYIANNATLTLKGATIEGSDIIGGATATVNLEVKNISPRSLNAPVMVRITNSQNAVFATREFTIQNARGNSTTSFKGITFQVDPGAISNQRVMIQGEVILSGGKYEARRVESFTATTTTDVNPAITEELSFDETPQIRSTFRRRTLIHNLEMDISAKIENLRDGYTVRLSPVRGSESLINLRNNTAGTGALSTSRTKQVKFSYTFPNEADGKTVQLKADFVYKGKIMKSQIITLRPH